MLRTKNYTTKKNEHEIDNAVDPTNRFQQFVVRVLDNMGNAVTDYRLDFHVVADSIKVSTWTGQSPPLAFKQYKKYNVDITEKVISDIEQHSVEPSYRTFFINIDELNKLLKDLGVAYPNAFISLNLDAHPSAPGVFYNTDLIKYVRLNSSFDGKSFSRKTHQRSLK